MREIMLQAVPNQRIDVSVGGVAWRIDKGRHWAAWLLVFGLIMSC